MCGKRFENICYVFKCALISLEMLGSRDCCQTSLVTVKHFPPDHSLLPFLLFSSKDS